ncbi:MAG: hypothetical protein QGG36_33055, partial [Pirellulaceae bacterium]|nr:hypothetical protein [Pirellulaceae bacterium]
MSQHHSISIALALVAVVVGRLSAAPPADPVERGQLIGAPISIDVEPRVIELKEPRASVQLVVTAKYADGSLRDLTALQLWKVVNPEVISVSPHGLVTGLNNGATDLQFRDGDNFLQRVAVVVSNASRPKPISFRREVMPVLSSAGCSDIRCHGAPSGKRGFRLSLWGADPLLDFQQLTRDGAGRRTNSFAPDKSLVLLKALSRVTHAGGRRFKPDSSFADLLRAWQAQGSRDDADSSALQSIEATPARRVLAAPARWQQLVVRATFADGHSEDVTGLTTFSSTDLAVANVDRGGLVEFHRQGEVAILCRFLGQMTSVRLIHIGQQPTDYQWPETQENNYIDTHVLAKLKLMRSPPS